jgi:class 3 adenylate cyclase/tetratricopeptide (TPR) repeat protein
MTVERAPLPSGRVTFAFIDVVSSTRTFIEHGQAYAAALRSLHATVAQHAESHGGAVVETEGDGAFLAFPDGSSAVDALVALQGGLEQPPPSGLHLRVRAGAHTGEAVPIDGHYLSLAVYVAARVSATANAGQVLVTDEVLDDLRDSDASMSSGAVDTGAYRLKDIPEPVRIWRIAGDDVAPRATPARRTNVQQTRTSFVGRGEELDRLRELVSRPGLVSVVGPGGTGKTRLASELALRDAETIPGGVWLVELATIEEPDLIVSAVGAVLGLTGATTSDLLLELKRRGRCLLVLDNCEHLLEPVLDLTEQLLDACSDLTLLCTSREALNLAGERAWTLPPLAVVNAATELFLERAADVSTAAPDLDLVRQLCTALDGLPLAIELAASQARSAPLQEIVAAVTTGSDPLSRRGGELRQRSLDAVLAWSLDRLTPAARNSLLTLSLFPGRFSPDMGRDLLAASAGCDPGTLRALARASLVDLDGPDYRLLWTIRDAARRRLEADPHQKRESLDGLATWAAAYGEERYQILSVHEDLTEDALLAVEVALDHALDAGLPGLGRAWHLLGVVHTARGPTESMMSLARRAARQLEPADADSTLALTSCINLLEFHQKGIGTPEETFARMAKVAREAGDVRLQVEVLRAAALQASTLDDWDLAKSHFLEALRLTEEHQEVHHEMPSILGNLGYCFYHSGDLSTAIDYTRQAAAAAAEQGLWHVQAVNHTNLAEHALGEQRPEEARDQALAALKLSPPTFVHRGVALAHLAQALGRLGNREAALVAGRQAKEILDTQQSLHENYRQALEALLTELPELGEAST